MFCWHCGVKLPPKAKFCIECGSSLAELASAEASAPDSPGAGQASPGQNPSAMPAASPGTAAPPPAAEPPEPAVPAAPPVAETAAPPVHNTPAPAPTAADQPAAPMEEPEVTVPVQPAPQPVQVPPAPVSVPVQQVAPPASAPVPEVPAATPPVAAPSAPPAAPNPSTSPQPEPAVAAVPQPSTAVPPQPAAEIAPQPTPPLAAPTPQPAAEIPPEAVAAAPVPEPAAQPAPQQPPPAAVIPPQPVAEPVEIPSTAAAPAPAPAAQPVAAAVAQPVPEALPDPQPAPVLTYEQVADPVAEPPQPGTQAGPTKDEHGPTVFPPVQPRPAPPPAPKKKEGGNGVTIAILLVLIALAGATAFYLYYFGFVRGDLNIANMFRQRQQEQSSQVSQEQPVPPSSVSSEDDGEIPSSSSEAEPVEAVVQEGQFPGFAHVSELYLFAQEDEENVFFLPTTSDDTVVRGVYRMRKDGFQPELVVGLALEDSLVPEDQALAVESFALLGDYLYFSSRLEDGRSGYYRLPKEGGEAQLLFIQEHSMLVSWSGKLYLLFPEQSAYGVYQPGTDTLPQVVPLEIEDRLLYQFSVYDGYLYFGAYQGNLSSYYRVNLSSGAQESLLLGEELGDSIVRPIWVGNDTFFVRHGGDSGIDSWLWLQDGWEEAQLLAQGSPVGGQVMSVARIREYFLFQIGQNYYWSTVENPTDSSVKVASMDQPFAVTENWIFFPTQVFPVEERGTPIPLANADRTPKDDFSAAYQEALALLEEMEDGQYAAALGGLDLGGDGEDGGDSPVDTLQVDTGGVPVAEQLAQELGEDNTSHLFAAVWALDSAQRGSMGGVELAPGLAALFSSSRATALLEQNNGLIPQEIGDCIATELYGILPDALYTQAQAGRIPGISAQNGSLYFEQWDQGEGILQSLVLVSGPTAAASGHRAVIEGTDSGGGKHTYDLVLKANEDYILFPYRYVEVVKR